MSSIVNTNMSNLTAVNALQRNERQLSTALEKLATGSKINAASDNAAGLAISTRLTSQIMEIDASIRNALDGISMVSAIDSALVEIEGMYQRMRELTVQSKNGTNSEQDIEYITAEFEALILGVESIISDTTYNDYNVFFNPSGQISAPNDWKDDGQAVVMDLTFNLGSAGKITADFIPDGAGGSYSFVDSDVLSSWGAFFYITPSGHATSAMGAFRGTNNIMVSNEILNTNHSNHRQQVSVGGTADPLVNIDHLLDNVSSSRAKLGATKNRLTYAIDNMSNIKMSTEASRSQILDSDYAAATSDFARAQIIQQAATAMVAQANQLPSTVLALLK